MLSGSRNTPECYDATFRVIPLRVPSHLRPSPAGTSTPRMRVGLFVTCLVDLMRPRIGFAALRLLQAAACDVV